MKRRDYRDYLRDMLESIDDIESFIGGMSLEELIDRSIDTSRLEP